MTEVKLDLDGLEGGPFVPIQGQSFSSEQEWINRASRRLTSHPEYRNTEHARALGWQGHHFTALCFDQKGRRMRNGGDFQRATEDNAYPVWWIWPDQIDDCFRALLALAREAEGQGWRDIESAPRGSWKDIPGPKGSTRRVHVPDLVILAGSDGETVTVSRWLPREERWNMFSKNETPLGWMPFPVHPAKATPPSRTQSGEDAA